MTHNLPIRWAVVRELSTDSPCITAALPTELGVYRTANVMPKGYTPTMVKLVLAAMTAEFVNEVGARP